MTAMRRWPVPGGVRAKGACASGFMEHAKTGKIKREVERAEMEETVTG